MARKRAKPEWAFTEESVKMLFGEEIVDLRDDGFEGSNEERQIFMEVFCTQNVNKRCDVTGAILFEVDEWKPSNAFSFANCENSTVTSFSSMKESSGEDVGMVNKGFGHGCVKHIKQSGELPNNVNNELNCRLSDSRIDFLQLESSKKASSGMPAAEFYCNGETVACHLVESSSLDIASSHDLHKYHEEMDASGRVDNVKASSIETKPERSPASDAKEVSELKPVTSPVSQESSASKRFPADKIPAVEDKPATLAPIVAEELQDSPGTFALIVAEELQDSPGSLAPTVAEEELQHLPGPLAPTVVEEELQDSDLFKSDSVDAAWKRDYIKNLRPRLRDHIKHIFLSAGWGIEMRRRKHCSYMDTVYLTPAMKVIYSLPCAWRSCGESLFSGGINSMQEENVRHWVDLNGFWYDLSDTLTYIETEMQRVESSVSLRQRWVLLDPFVTMVFIDRKIGILRAGTAVKVVNGVVVELKRNQGMILTAENVGGGKNLLGVTSADQLGTLKQSLVLAHESDSIFTEVDACIHGTPVVTKRVEMVEGIENVHNRDGGSGIFSISREQNHRNASIKFICTPDGKLYPDVDSCKSTIKSLSRCMDDGSTNARDLGSMVPILSSSETKGTLVSEHDSAMTKKAFLSAELPANDCLVKGSEMFNSEPSRSQVLNAGNDGSEVHEAKEQVHESKIPAEHNQWCEKLTSVLQIGCLHLQEEKLHYGVDQQCNGEVLAHKSTPDIVPEITMQPEMDSSVCQRFCKEVPSFVLDEKFKASKVASVCQEENGLSVTETEVKRLRPPEYLEEEIGSAFEVSATGDASAETPGTALMKGTCKKSTSITGLKATKSHGQYKKDDVLTPKHVESQSSNLINLQEGQEITPCNSKRSLEICGSVIPSGCNANSIIGNQHCKEILLEHKMPFLYLHENVCLGLNEVLVHENSFHVAKEGAIQGEQSAVYRACLPGREFPFDFDDKDEYNQEVSIQLRKQNSSKMGVRREALEQFEFCEEELNIVSYSSKFKKEGVSTATAEIGSTKKIRKRSKKASESNVDSDHERVDLPPTQNFESKDNNFTNLDVDCDGITHHLRKSQRRSIGFHWKESPRASPVNSFHHEPVSSSKLKKFQLQHGEFNESVVTIHDHKSQTMSNCDNTTGEFPSHHPSDAFGDLKKSRKTLREKKPECMAFQTITKTLKARKCGEHTENGRKRVRTCLIDDNDLLVSAIIKAKDFCSDIKHPSLKTRKLRSKAARKLKNRKGCCKLLLRSPGKGGKHSMDGNWSLGARTVLSWLLDVGVLSVNDVIQYRSPKDGTVVKNGQVTRDGLICKCCNKKLSLSEFKSHAGFKTHRPCLNLFLETGDPFTLCLFQAWSSEYKARKGGKREVQLEVDENDDTCGLCGDGGELICCDQCPSTFHQSCLSTQELPEGNWYCPNCTCEICGDVVNEKEAPKPLVGLQCSQCENKYHKMCLNEKGLYKEEVVSDTWFCGGNCQEVYSGLRSRIGVQNSISDGFSWMLLRCIHGDQKIHSAQRFSLMAECNTKLAVALTIMEESFLPMMDPRTGIDMIPHVLYNWGSDFTRLNYEGFYTVVLEKDDELISVASIRVHGVTLAEMPLIATCSEHRRQGMCRRLMNAIEELLKSFKVEMLLITAIPNLVETWTSGFGFKHISNKEKEQLTRINLMMFPGTTLLKKTLCGKETVETREAGLVDELSLGTDGSKEVSVCDQRTVIEAGSLSFEIDLETSSVPLNFKGLPLEEQQDSHFIDTPSRATSTPQESKYGDVSNSDCYSAGRQTFDAFDGCRLVSTEQVVSEASLGCAPREKIYSNSNSNISHEETEDKDLSSAKTNLCAQERSTDCMANQESIVSFSHCLCPSENSRGDVVEEKEDITHDVRKNEITSDGKNDRYAFGSLADRAEGSLMLAPNSNMANLREVAEPDYQADSFKISPRAACFEGKLFFSQDASLPALH